MNKAPGGSPDARRRALGENPSDFVRSVWLELRRVTWPTREEYIAATLLTIGLVVVCGLFTFLCDQAFAWLFQIAHPK